MLFLVGQCGFDFLLLVDTSRSVALGHNQWLWVKLWMHTFLEQLNDRTEIGLYTRVAIFSFSNYTEVNARLTDNLDVYSLQDIVANDYEGITLQAEGKELAMALQEVRRHMVENTRYDESGQIKAGQTVVIFTEAKSCGHLSFCGLNSRRNILSGLRSLMSKGISVYIVGKHNVP